MGFPVHQILTCVTGLSSGVAVFSSIPIPTPTPSQSVGALETQVVLLVELSTPYCTTFSYKPLPSLHPTSTTNTNFRRVTTTLLLSARSIASYCTLVSSTTISSVIISVQPSGTTRHPRKNLNISKT